MYRLGTIAAKYDRDLTLEEHEKCKKDTIAFYGTDCISKNLDWVDSLKGEPRKVKNKIVEYELQLTAHIGSVFDTYIVLNSLSNWDRIVNIVKYGKVSSP